MVKSNIKTQKFVTYAVKYLFLTAVLFFTVIPLIYTVMSAFKTNTEIMTHPEAIFPIEPTLDNFRQAIQSEEFNVLKMFWNSLWYSTCCVAITVTASSLLGYVFARGGSFPGSKVIFAAFSSLMFVSFGSITIYAVFEVLNLVHLSDSLWGLVVMKIFSVGIINVYLVRSYIRTLPTSLDEAAEIDGCSFIGIFFKIILPLLKPIIATITILAFNGSWNDYLMPTLFTISRPDQYTLIVGIIKLKNSGTAAANWNLMLAGATVALIPIFVIYAFCNKYFVEGLTNGAVKG